MKEALVLTLCLVTSLILAACERPECKADYHLKASDMSQEDWAYWPHGQAEVPILKHKYFGCPAE